MSCDIVRPRIRTFLDDLLDEKEYQDIHRHLEACERCRVYASSVGTLSYRLYELSQAPLPPDMVSTILYELKKQNNQSEPIQENAAAIQKPISFFWIFVMVLAALSVVSIASLVLFRKMHAPQETISFLSSKPADSSNAGSLNQKNQTKLEKIKTIIYADTAAGTPDQQLLKIKEVLGSAENGDLLGQWHPTHWHYHVSASSQTELIELIRQMQVVIDHESKNLFVFYIPKQKLEQFKARMSQLTGVIKEYGESDSSQVTDDSIQVSAYLE